MATETVENYLKALHALCRGSPTGEAGVVRLAAVLGVTKGSATSMVRKLCGAKLAKAERYGGVTLTAKGTRAAVDVLRRHRLIETFLVQTLKLDWADVHAEAERLEHAVSPLVLEALDRHLGRPGLDPHGDPIPDAYGKTRELVGVPLSECAAGARVRVVRITDQDRGFLTFIAEHGLRPGARAAVVGVSGEADSITVQVKGHRAVSMSLAAARKVLAEVA